MSYLVPTASGAEINKIYLDPVNKKRLLFTPNRAIPMSFAAIFTIFLIVSPLVTSSSLTFTGNLPTAYENPSWIQLPDRYSPKRSHRLQTGQNYWRIQRLFERFVQHIRGRFLSA
ncbi:hypothetical protein OIU78_015303 [Salix suchowensis]|nr:hypothetical protein OIU78_015303 [Salix suchowensis]